MTEPLPKGQTTFRGAAVISDTSAPAQGYVNSYDASAGTLSIALPSLSGLNPGANFIVEKSITDPTLNAVTFTADGSDTFDDGATSLTLSRPGRLVLLQTIWIAGTTYWKVLTCGELTRTGGIAAITSQLALSNSTTPTTVITTTLPAVTLAAGSTYRIKLLGTVRVKATSGTLTFTPYIQNTALNTIQMASQTSAEGPVGFSLEILITVRTTGATGTAIAHGDGVIKFATNSELTLTSTNTSATTIDTTSAAASTALLIQATWATADSNNALAVEIASIERLI
ncbi:hypothetical protein [Mycobacterium marinum]|uniref:hypothetical protein n=1 Tax=Mycobacterium marinum TaxID=1781 RepID=UPI000B97406F|nr:hypothetical protein [Mycobacterium marinum]